MFIVLWEKLHTYSTTVILLFCLVVDSRPELIGIGFITVIQAKHCLVKRMCKMNNSTEKIQLFELIICELHTTTCHSRQVMGEFEP